MVPPDLRRSSSAEEFQRARIIAATAAVASEHGIAGVTVSRVIAEAHLSRRTFYELFDDCGECLRAAYEQIIDQAASRAVTAYVAEKRWVDRVRAGLNAALEFFDEQPQLARLCFVEAPGAGRQMLPRRAQLISSLAEIFDADYAAERSSRVLAEFASRAFLGGVFEILHLRLLANQRVELAELSGELMAVIVLPFLGPVSACRELGRRPKPPGGKRATVPTVPFTAPRRPPTRLTYRTLLTLSVISQSPGLSNRQISERVGIKDQGQISKLLSRLCELRLIENDGAGQAHGAANAWRLAPGGMQLIQSVSGRRSSDLVLQGRSQKVARSSELI